MVRIGVLTGGGGRDDLLRQLSPLGTIEWLECAGALADRASNDALDVVVTGLRDENARSVAAAVVEVAARRPRLPVIVHTRIHRSSLDDLLAVFAPGLRMECVVQPYARFEPVLRHILSPGYRPSAAPLLLHHFVAGAPLPLAVFVALAILSARERRGVEELAGWTGVSPRTIERRLQQAGWPSAFIVLHSFTALDAVWLMSEYGWSAQRVQRERGFPTPSSVTRLLASYAGTRPSTLAEDGGFAAALEHVIHRLMLAP